MALQARKVADITKYQGTCKTDSIQMVLVIEQLNSTSTCLTKISILFFYRRLARGIYTSKFIRIVQANIIFVAAYLLVFSVVLFLTCYPFESYWRQFDIIWVQQNTYKCFNEAANTVAANAISILQDFIACGLPSVLLWRLQMPKKKKILLGTLLGLGILPCIAGLLRLLYTIRLYSTYDSTWAAHPVFVWTVAETHLGILCASAPALHSLAKELASRSRAVSSLFRYLSSSVEYWRSSGSGSNNNKRRSASGHIELADVAEARAKAEGGTKGSGSRVVTTTTRSDTLFSSTTLNGESVRSVAAGVKDDGDLERGVVDRELHRGHQPLFDAAENARRRGGGGAGAGAGLWYLETLPEVSPIRLAEEDTSMAYLDQRLHDEGGLLTRSSSGREEEEYEEEEIGVAVRAAPMTASSLDITRDRRN
ncbi:hypothetical protein SLS57_003929 [Botryosphaeria dothidea]